MDSYQHLRLRQAKAEAEAEGADEAGWPRPRLRLVQAEAEDCASMERESWEVFWLCELRRRFSSKGSCDMSYAAGLSFRSMWNVAGAVLRKDAMSAGVHFTEDVMQI